MKHQVIKAENFNDRDPLFEQGFSECSLEALNAPNVSAFKPPNKIYEDIEPKDKTVFSKARLPLLQKSPIFEGLAEETLQQLLSNSVLRSVDQDTAIIRHGDVVNFVYLIIEGAVKIFRSSSEGKETPICMPKSGETFMESVMFMDGVSPVSVQALKPCKLLLIPVNILKQQIPRDGQLSSNILRIIARHYKNTIQQVDSVMTQPPLDRLGYYLLRQRMEQNPESLSIELQDQKSMLAKYLGMKPETFSRALKKLKAMGIGVSSRGITLREDDALCGFCDPDTAFDCPKSGTANCHKKANPNS